MEKDVLSIKCCSFEEAILNSAAPTLSSRLGKSFAGKVLKVKRLLADFKIALWSFTSISKEVSLDSVLQISKSFLAGIVVSPAPG